MTFSSKYKTFHSLKCIWWPFCPGEDRWVEMERNHAALQTLINLQVIIKLKQHIAWNMPVVLSCFVLFWFHYSYCMMTSSNGAFSALLVLGEFPAQRPVMTRSFDVFFDLRLNKRLSKQSWGWWFETLPCPLWRHCISGTLHWHWGNRLTSLMPVKSVTFEDIGETKCI